MTNEAFNQRYESLDAGRRWLLDLPRHHKRILLVILDFLLLCAVLWGQFVSGIRVYRPEKLGRIIERFGVKEILLAIPAHERNARRMVLKELENYPVIVKVMPSLVAPSRTLH